jgi:hypothetical protein
VLAAVFKIARSKASPPQQSSGVVCTSSQQRSLRSDSFFFLTILCVEARSRASQRRNFSLSLCWSLHRSFWELLMYIRCDAFDDNFNEGLSLHYIFLMFAFASGTISFSLFFSFRKKYRTKLVSQIKCTCTKSASHSRRCIVTAKCYDRSSGWTSDY